MFWGCALTSCLYGREGVTTRCQRQGVCKYPPCGRRRAGVIMIAVASLSGVTPPKCDHGILHAWNRNNTAGVRKIGGSRTIPARSTSLDCTDVSCARQFPTRRGSFARTLRVDAAIRAARAGPSGLDGVRAIARRAPDWSRYIDSGALSQRRVRRWRPTHCSLPDARCSVASGSAVMRHAAIAQCVVRRL